MSKIVTIEQSDKDSFKITLCGDNESLLKGLAGAVNQLVKTAPKSYQQEMRTRFLMYLNMIDKQEDYND